MRNKLRGKDGGVRVEEKNKTIAAGRSPGTLGVTSAASPRNLILFSFRLGEEAE